jgi:hypothetical protein
MKYPEEKLSVGGGKGVIALPYSLTAKLSQKAPPLSKTGFRTDI